MYTSIGRPSLARTDVFVVSDTAMSHVINLLASVVKARNPLITAPPAASPAWRSAGDLDAADELMAALDRAIADPAFMKVGPKDPAGPAADPAYGRWLLAAANLGVSGLLTFSRVYANDNPTIKDALTILSSEERTSLSSIPLGKRSLKELLDADPMREPFARFALTMAYEQIVKGGLFDRITPTEGAVEKQQYVMMERGLLMATMLRVLAIQTLLLRLRPALRYLRTEPAKFRLREEMIPAHVEYWEAIIDRILALPVHPWIARAEEASLPTPRKTPWGDATPSILLERGLIASPWDGSGTPNPAELRAAATAVTEHLDPPRMLDSFTSLLKELRRMIDDLEVGGRLAKISATLGFTQPRSAMSIPLWGDAFRVVHTDGLNSTESVQDLIALSFQPHLPAQGKLITPWVGEESWQSYTGAMRSDSVANVWSEHVAAFLVAPEDVVVDLDFYTSRFSPQMFKFRKESYMGDADALMFPATLEGVAEVFGLSPLEMEQRIKEKATDWRHIFTVEGGAVTPVQPTELLFYSSRTRMTWFTTITLPRRGVPRIMWPLRRGRADTGVPTTARMARDTIVPVATVPLKGAVDSLIATAIPVKLGGVK